MLKIENLWKQGTIYQTVKKLQKVNFKICSKNALKYGTVY